MSDHTAVDGMAVRFGELVEAWERIRGSFG
jgi:myo-inositol catabolism protein IolC